MARKNDVLTEVVSFKTIDGIGADRLIEVVNALDTAYLSTIDGYIDAELIRGPEDRSWIMVIHWKNTDATTEALKQFPTSPLTAEYRSILDPQSINLHMGEQLETWCAER